MKKIKVDHKCVSSELFQITYDIYFFNDAHRSTTSENKRCYGIFYC